VTARIKPPPTLRSRSVLDDESPRQPGKVDRAAACAAAIAALAAGWPAVILALTASSDHCSGVSGSSSAKGQTTPLPPDLVRRPVIAPQVYWTWSLIWRRGEERPAVLAAVDSLTDKIGDLGMRGPAAWLPDSDPHKQ
jgi:hypothetical protein